MEWLWTWGGVSFGYREGGQLWTHDGRHVGRFDGDEIFGTGGGYLGELQNGNRLITSLSKKGRQGYAFTPHASRVGFVPYVDYLGYVMYVGFEDFPTPDDL